ncbi:MAG: alpha-L-arabinofuranosidase, partial [Actinomycetota bacterium]|nr:alpha-L-arabinofuranosidase [Actinomycetota bacterium]
YDQVDYISLHAYYEEDNGDLDSFLASAVDMDAFIDEVTSTCDYAKALQRSEKTMRLSFDEWNVWYQKAYHAQPARDWESAPHLIEDTFSVVDAVVVGSYLISLLNHADRVGVACQAQLANIIAPIRTEPGGPAWRQTIFYPFALMAQHAHGRALQVPLTTPSISTARFGDVPGVQCAATHDERTGRLALFLVNRNRSEAQDLQVDLRTLGDLTVLDHQVLADDDIRATNSAAAPDRVTPTLGGGKVVDGALVLSLPAVSFSAVVLGSPGTIG